MNKDNKPFEQRIDEIDNVDDRSKAALREFMAGVDRLRAEAKTNLELRNGLLTDPYAELKKRGIPFFPTAKLRFIDVKAGEICLPLEPFQGK